MLNSNFNKKLSLFKILFILREDEAKINKEFNFYNNKGYLNNHVKKFCKLEKSKDSVVNHHIKLATEVQICVLHKYTEFCVTLYNYTKFCVTFCNYTEFCVIV